MPRRIVVFGATGYTGRLVAAALVRAKARPVIAGRSAQNLAALGVQLGKGLPTAVADVNDPDSLLAMIQPDDVLVSTVGPFARYGRPVVEAAILRKATYIDTCGEPEFLRTVFETLGPVATQAGVAMVPALAYEYVAGNLAAALVLESAGNLAARVDVAYFVTGQLRTAASTGTKASAGGAAMAPHHAWRDGRLVTSTAGDRVRSFKINGSSRPAMAIGGSEHLVIPQRRPWIREVGVYLGGPRSARVARLAGQTAAVASRVPGVPEVVRFVTSLPRTNDGPDEEQRSQAVGTVVAKAYDSRGRELGSVQLGGSNPYDFTGSIVAWAAMQAARDELQGVGALGPVEAFGLGRLRRACTRAGLDTID